MTYFFIGMAVFVGAASYGELMKELDPNGYGEYYSGYYFLFGVACLFISLLMATIT